MAKNLLQNHMLNFVIGASLPVTLPFLLGAQRIPERTFKYEEYSWKAPLYFGTVNALSGLLFPNAPLKKRLFWTSQLSALFIMILITKRQAYHFKTKQRWYWQYVILWLSHTFAFNVVIYALTRLLKK